MRCHHGNALLHHRLLYQHLSRHRVVPLLHEHPCIAHVHVHRATQPLCLRVELRLPKLDLVADVAFPVLRHPFVHWADAGTPPTALGRHGDLGKDRLRGALGENDVTRAPRAARTALTQAKSRGFKPRRPTTSWEGGTWKKAEVGSRRLNDETVEKAP